MSNDQLEKNSLLILGFGKQVEKYLKNNMAKDKQTIELTKKQFLALLKAVYLGNWVANSYRDGSTEDPHLPEYENIEDYIFSLAPKFSLEKYVTHDLEDGDKYYPTNLFEQTTDVHKLHDAYDEETFWDELTDRMGTKDFLKKYSKEQIEKMNKGEWFTKLHECIDEMDEEFSEFGLDRTQVNKKLVNI